MSQMTRAGAIAVGALALASTAVVAPVQALPAPQGASAPHANGHKVAYPTVQAARHARAGQARGLAGVATGTGLLNYHGAIDGIGVTTGKPKVYLVVWGSQWGTQGSDGSGNLTFSGDSSNEAPALQKLFKGIGTGNEQWSGVMTQYCEGIGSGATSCPASSAHVGYPSGGAFAGIWYDNSASAPTNATDHQIGVEAYAALQHFGNTSAGASRNAQYVVLSPKGTHPGGFNTGFFGPQFCAWHDYNGDTTLNGGAITSSYGDFAFTNMPYVTDLGASCGANYVNSGTAGSGDGITIVEGHEYAETITDQNPGGGWLDSATPSQYENGDKCAWVGTGGTTGAQNVQFGTQGSFAMQSTFSNEVNDCQIAHAIVGASTNVVTVTAPSTASSTQAVPITPLGVSAGDSDPNSATFTWTATGAPGGLTLASTGATTAQFTGTPTTQGTFTVVVTATDSAGAQGTATISWTVTGNVVTVTKPADQSTAQYSPATAVTLSATDIGGSTTFTWSVSGQPLGISLSGNQLVGTPTQAGPFTVTVTAKDGTGATGSSRFNWTVTSVPVTVTVSGVPATITSTHRLPMNPTYIATASDAPNVSQVFSWTLTGQPSGVTIGRTTGLISGTLGRRTAGIYNAIVTATDGLGHTGTWSIHWTVL